MDEELHKKIMAFGNQDEKAQCGAYTKEESELQDARMFNKVRVVIFMILFIVGTMSGEINPEIGGTLIFLFVAYEFAYFSKTKDNIWLRTNLATSEIETESIRDEYCYFRNH